MQIVAEIAASHNGSLERAFRTIDAAADAGATHVKFQTWSPDSMCIADRWITGGPWNGKSLKELYAEAHTPWEWFPHLFTYAKTRGLIPFSTPFDRASVDFLETLECPIYKVASFEIVDLPLIRYIASKGKPMIISTGMASSDDICSAQHAAIAAWDRDELTFLKCVSAYPAPADEMNLATMAELRSFGAVGLSDHTMASEAAVIATALGATVIEKHLCLSRADGGPDAGFSLEPHEFAEHVQAIRRTQAIIGKVQYGPMPSEMDSLQFRRSLWVKEDIKAGSVITEENICTARPNEGLAPKHWQDIIGKQVLADVSHGTPLTAGMICDFHPQP